MHATPGLFSWNMDLSWRLQVACLHLKYWTIYILRLPFRSILPCERADLYAKRLVYRLCTVLFTRTVL